MKINASFTATRIRNILRTIKTCDNKNAYSNKLYQDIKASKIIFE